MNKLQLVVGSLLFLLIVLTGCGSDPDATDLDSTVGSTADDGSPEKKDSGTILESGFGQQDEYVWAMAVVKNGSDHAGQTVTVTFNLKDKAGKLIGSGSQVAAFNWAGQELPVATQIDLGPRVKAANMEAAVLVEDDGTFDDTVVEDAWPTFPGKIEKSEYGSWEATFTVKNPTADPLNGASFQVICHNKAGKIMAGGSTYPELIPASGETLVTIDSLYTNAKPAKCVGYLHPWM